MAHSYRDPPRQMFRRSELRRLMSMAFLLVILLMIIQNSRGPGNRRLLIGRAGQQDQIVGEIDDQTIDRPERVPAVPTNKTKAGDRTMALLQGNGSPLAALNPVPKAVDATRSTGPNAAPLNHDTPRSAIPGTAAPSGSPPVPAATTEPAAGRQPRPNALAKSIPPANGPTDEDLDEASAADEDLQYVDDYSLGTQPPEMPAYERLTRWVTNQSYERLAARSEFKKPIYSQILAGANDFRGKLFQFDLHVQRVIPYPPLHFYHSEDDPHEPVQLYEMWGNTGEGRGRLYQLIVYDPPAGMPIGPDIQEDVRFVGYFFKLQGYEPARALPGAKPEVAPTFIGRVLWMERPPGVWFHQADIWWLAALGGGVLVVLFAWFAWLFLRRRRLNVAQMAVGRSIPRSVSIDEWLAHPESGGNAGGQNSRGADEFAES